jgi:hypothetical protein
MLKTRVIRLVTITAASAGLILAVPHPAKADIPKWPGTRVDCTYGSDGKTPTCTGWLNDKPVYICTQSGCMHL